MSAATARGFWSWLRAAKYSSMRMHVTVGDRVQRQHTGDSKHVRQTHKQVPVTPSVRPYIVMGSTTSNTSDTHTS